MYVCLYVCMYLSRLGMQLFPALRANVCARAPLTAWAWAWAWAMGMSLPEHRGSLASQTLSRSVRVWLGRLKSRRLRRSTLTAGFLHVSGRVRDSGQLYQGLFAEGISRGAYHGLLPLQASCMYCARLFTAY